MSRHEFLILSERPPPCAERAATGLSLRHALMAKVLAGRGVRVTYAWTETDPSVSPRDSSVFPFDLLALESAEQLSEWLQRHRPAVIVLGYWELCAWLPEPLDAPLVLDYIAPRLLERQFENRDRLGPEAAALIALLARCERVLVGNRRQRDMMLPWLLLAGHDCRHSLPVDIVPIAGRVDARSDQGTPAPDRQADGQSLVLYHGGRDWPWRDSTAWLDALRRNPGPWRLDNGSEAAGLAGHAEYLQRLRAADLLLELCDENIERRYSQSFRMTDALCNGVPVVCNRFLPLAALVERHACGWTIDRAEDLPALLNSIAADRAELDRRAANALALARSHFDAGRVYGALADELIELAEQPPKDARRPLLEAASERPEKSRTGLWRAARSYLSVWSYRRLRRPWHSWLSRRMAGRPMPEAGRDCWVILSRPDVFPTDHGAAVKIERTAWGLSFHINQVILLTDRRDGYWLYRRGEREFRRFPWLQRLAGWPRAVGIIRLMARGIPYSNSFLYLPCVDRGMQFRLLWLLKRYPVEVVQGEFPAYARPAVWAARLFGTRSLMVEHNVEYKRIAEQVPELGEAAERLLRNIEIDLCNACDRVITVSNRDRRDLISAGVREALVHTIPHGVDLERFNRAAAVDLRERYAIPPDHAVLVYHGIYSYPPNLEAVEELAHVLLPKLRLAGRAATVVAIGPEPPAKSLPGVVFTGAVEDLAAHLKGGDLAVIPLRQGGGTRMKILDDFAARVPVITTHKGMEGIGVAHGEELLIIDDPDEMAESVIRLLSDAPARDALAKAALQWVSRFDWREIARQYVETMRGERAPAPRRGS